MDTSTATKDRNKEIALTIAQQMGGTRRLNMFTGADHFIAIDRGLTFRIPGKNFSKDSINVITITLTPLDEYTMVFSRLRALKMTEVVRYEGVYCDQLIPLFEEATGLYLSFK